MRADRFYCAGLLAAVILSPLDVPQACAFLHFGNGVASKWGEDTAVGTGATVTWSFVTDGTTVDPDFEGVGVIGGSDISQLRTLIDTNHGEGSFDGAIQRAFDTWSAVADIEFVQVADPGTTMAAPGSVTPNIRIGAYQPDPEHAFFHSGARAFGPPGFIVDPEVDFPESGDIFFNLNGTSAGGQQTPFHIAEGVEDVTPVDVFNFGDDLEGLFLHELGHAAIGLDHPPWDGENPDRRVMYVGDFAEPDAPFCCTALNRELHSDDIAGARFVYGLKADYDEDQDVDGNDFLLWQRDLSLGEFSAWQANYGAENVSAQLTGIPEPEAALLCALGILLIASTRQIYF